MKLEYGKNSTYPHELDKDRLEWCSDTFNRSKGQTQFLFQLVNGDFEKLKQLELKIKQHFVWGCPGTKEEVDAILQIDQK